MSNMFGLRAIFPNVLRSEQPCVGVINAKVLRTSSDTPVSRDEVTELFRDLLN